MRALRSLVLFVLLAAVAFPAPAAPAASPAVLRTATTHPMKYHLSLPDGWVEGERRPVAVLVPDASRDFAGNLAAFEKARGSLPFILVAPHVVTSGGANYRLADSYRSPNWRGRWVAEADWSRSPARAALPVKVLFCDRAKTEVPAGWDAWAAQSKEAMALAQAHGFASLSLENLPGRAHGPLAGDVIAFFEAVRGALRKTEGVRTIW